MAAAAAPKSVQKGVVKQVMSGDTIVIRGPPRGGPPPERTLSLAGVTAPRLARRPNNADEPETKDEPWAWFSREQLRKKLVGKEITFVVDYTVPSGREFGTVFLGSENIVKTAVQNGWVKIREGGRNEGEEWEELVRLGSVAQDTKLGVHADDNGKAVRRISWTQENMRAVVDRAKGAPVDAVIEQVRDGSTLRAFLLPSFEYVTIFLTGIKSPSFKKTEKGEEAEEFAAEAKFYVESRLLQRDVKIVLEGVNNQNYLGTVQHPVGNISEFLLGDGLARIADWSIGNVTNNRDKYRAAESAAKAKKLRLWSKYVSSAAAIPLKDKVFTAVVEEIVNVECIIVRAGDVSRKVWLSSIRAPKAKADESAAEAKKKSMYDIPYAFEAREFLRKKLIGQKVKVEVDYIKPAQDSFPEKTSVTLWADTINIGEALVSKGYATVLRHRQDDDQRSAQYDNLLAAETRAQKNEKGVHNTKEAPLHRVNDLTGKDNKTIAERSLPSLQRAGRVSAVVEYVASGSRLRVYVPKETCLISLVLAGISCPRSAMPQTPAEPFGEEALQATRRAVLQREVEIEIETIDKTGNFVGHVYFEGKNLSVLLLEQGLASLHFSADRYKNANIVAAAERGAKEAKLGLWENYVEPEAAAAPVEQKERKTDYKKVVVTEVTGSTKFWVQNDDAEAQVTAMMQQLQSVASAGSVDPKHGVLCAAKFSDGQWYRAKLLKNGDKFEVLYIDYGNKEPAPLSQLSAIPPAISAIAPFAREYTLAYVNPPTADYEDEVTSYFRQLVLNKHFLLNVEYRDGATEYATLVDGPSKTEAATVLLAAGYLTVKNRREEYLKGLMAEYNKAQSVSKQNRLGMWIYGDITPDDDREFGMRK